MSEQFGCCYVFCRTSPFTVKVMKKLYCVCCLLLTCLLWWGGGLSQPAAASTLLFSEDFDSDFSKWQLLNGQWSYWYIQNQAAYAYINQTYRMSTLLPRDEWWSRVDVPYRVEFLFQTFDNSDKNFVLGMRDVHNFIDVHFYGGQLMVEQIRDGLSVRYAAVPWVLQKNRVYQLRADYSSAGFSLLIDGQLAFSSPAEWLPLPVGKFGLKASAGAVSNSRVMFDQIRVTTLVDPRPTFKQDQAEWAAETYDHASVWSTQPTLQRWGCAVTAAAMLLRFHGFEWLGERLLDPSSLNAWLQTQSDGYVGDGLLNWLAISRLSRELAQASAASLPSLEFSYVSGAWAELRAALLARLGGGPQIGSTGGHFLLIDEHEVIADDFTIRDPLFAYKWLSESAPLRSLRLFQPSFTDLSYVLLVLPRALSVSALEEDWQEMEESLVAAAGDETTGENYRLFIYRQPPEQLLTLSFFGAGLHEVDLARVQLFVYQQQGELTVFNLAEQLVADLDLSKVERLRWQLDYQQQAPSTSSVEVVEKSADTLKLEYLDALLSQVNQAWQARQLSFYLYYQLQQLIGTLREALDYLWLLDEFFAFYDLSFAKYN